MIEFTEEDRAKLIGLAHVIEHPDPEGVEGPDFAPSDARFLRKLAERPAGDAGLREKLRSEEAKKAAADAYEEGVQPGDEYFGDRREIEYMAEKVVRAAVDTAEGGQS